MSIYVHLFWFFFDCKSAEMHCSFLPRQHLLSQSAEHTGQREERANVRENWNTGKKEEAEEKSCIPGTRC